MKRVWRLGTRDSALAHWQANSVKTLLEKLGAVVELVPIKSTGDLVTDQPLYAMGITGIFTKALDIALLEERIDLAVHSMKDVPTLLPEKLAIGAVMKRGNPRDLLVHKGTDFLNTEGIIATGSLRRKAQWLHRYPQHEVEGLRGNVETRLRKLEDSSWNAAIFAAAGLERLGISPGKAMELKWMVPAPAQGAIAVMAREEDPDMLEILKQINHRETAICTREERAFLRKLEGGCSAPIGALAEIRNGEIHFSGEVLSIDGSKRVTTNISVSQDEAAGLGVRCAEDILNRGGKQIMDDIRSNLST